MGVRFSLGGSLWPGTLALSAPTRTVSGRSFPSFRGGSLWSVPATPDPFPIKRETKGDEPRSGESSACSSTSRTRTRHACACLREVRLRGRGKRRRGKPEGKTVEKGCSKGQERNAETAEGVDKVEGKGASPTMEKRTNGSQATTSRKRGVARCTRSKDRMNGNGSIPTGWDRTRRDRGKRRGWRCGPPRIRRSRQSWLTRIPCAWPCGCAVVRTGWTASDACRTSAMNTTTKAARLGGAFKGASSFTRVHPKLVASVRRSGSQAAVRPAVVQVNNRTVVIGLAADSGCGKSTFMRRMTSIFGGDPKPPKGGNPDSNSLISDMTTVICLDDYHSLDRYGRKDAGVTALAPEAQNFDLMYDQVKALREGKPVDKPIYNHVTGILDPAETIQAPNILVIEGLHPFFDERVRDLLDFKIYLDISDDVKFAWKIQRDMAERGHSLQSIKASIEARKPDFDAYIDPQKQVADVVIQVLPTQLIPDDNEGKVLRVRMIQKEGVKNFTPVYLYDEGSTISWIPCGRKLTCSYPGIKFFYGPDTYYGQEVSVLEMDGQFDKLDELIYVESHLSNTSAKYYGEITQQMLKHAEFPGSNNGTGLFQTLVGLKVREVYEKVTATESASAVAS